jgi:hypothetical protein
MILRLAVPEKVVWDRTKALGRECRQANKDYHSLLLRVVHKELKECGFNRREFITAHHDGMHNCYVFGQTQDPPTKRAIDAQVLRAMQGDIP